MSARGWRLREIAVWVLVIAVWEGLLVIIEVPTYVVPSPSGVVRAFVSDIGWIASHSLVTAGEIAAGLGIAVALAIPLAVILVSVPLFRRAVYPLMVFAQAAPKEALAPLFIMWFGFSMLPKVLLAAVISFFPVLVSTTVGLERFDENLSRLARSIGASRMKTLLSFRMWVALPSFFGGLRLGVTLAAVGAVIGEFLGSDNGIGYLVLNASRRLDGEMLYASLIILVILVLGLVWLVDATEERLLRGAGRGATAT
ncbi:MAG: ABC transporter permease subunit [Acidimicrobiia bacterium]|nr:ABC transporter permease subunit [Acidimicrobiia bacterium]